LFAEVSNRSHAGKAFAKFNAVNYNYKLSKFSATFRVSEEDAVYSLEKKLPGKTWRKDNNHDGGFDSVISIARQK
jgi:hypothetical protein